MVKKDDLDDIFGSDTTPKKAKPVVKKKATKKKVAKKAAKRSVPEAATNGTGRGRQAGEARGVPGVGMFAVLRAVFSRASGATVDQGIAALMKNIGDARAATGKEYPERMARSRVQKFLTGAKTDGVLKLIKETKSGDRYFRYDGEVTVSRGAPPKKKATKKKVAKKKAAAK